MPKNPETIDIQISRSGGVILFVALTQSSLEWVHENVSLESWQWLGNASFAVEHRYAEELVAAMQVDGLTVE
ncbi:MAG: hypothetical protein WCT04_06250 [Planctomycetota bacterium]